MENIYNLSEATFRLLMLTPTRITREKLEMTCIECGRDFHKRENTKIDNLFCSFHCQDRHDIERYWQAPENLGTHIPNANIIAKVLYDYEGRYSE